MSTIAEEFNAKAGELGIPLAVHLDLTYRCNERCVHCYLDHDDKGEMSYDEIARLLSEMSDAGVFQLTLSGGEPLLRKDFFAIARRARELSFNVRLKTNAILIGEKEAELIRELYLDSVQISIYSDRAEVHDAITKVPGSLKRSLTAARFLRSRGLKVTLAHVVMKQNFGDHPRVREIANEMGAHFTVDPTITPHINGDRSILSLNVANNNLKQLMHDKTLIGSDDFLAPPTPATDAVLDGAPCSAGHSLCYISPYGDVYPCVQFPLPSGNVRRQAFIDIWRDSPQLKEVRSIRIRDLPTCSICPHSGSCSRCPGLAYMEGNMRGPSSADCGKSYARTGVPTAGMLAR